MAHKEVKGEKRQEETTQITLLTLNLTKASDFTLDIEPLPPLWGGDWVCVGKVFTHLWDKLHTSQGREDQHIPVHKRDQKFNTSAKLACWRTSP